MSARPVRPRHRFLVFGAPVIEEAEIAEVVATLRSGWLGTGPRVAQFERDFRSYKGAEHAVAVSSCTAALHLEHAGGGHRPRATRSITSALTFCATVNAIIHAGATPVLVDVDAASMNIDGASGRVEHHRANPRRRPRAFRRPPLRDGGAVRRRATPRPQGDRRLRARDRSGKRRTADRDVRRFRLLQLLRHQERRHRRGRHAA